MRLDCGKMLWMNNDQTGDTLYMVVNSPVLCETCGKAVYDWETDDAGALECPHCGHEIREFSPFRCQCGENDRVSLVVAANNNFGCCHDGEMIPYNHMVNRVVTVCGKVLEGEIRAGKIRLLPVEETAYRKRLLLWTSQNTYEPGKAMPQWIRERFPDQESDDAP